MALKANIQMVYDDMMNVLNQESARQQNKNHYIDLFGEKSNFGVLHYKCECALHLSSINLIKASEQDYIKKFDDIYFDANICQDILVQISNMLSSLHMLKTNEKLEISIEILKYNLKQIYDSTDSLFYFLLVLYLNYYTDTIKNEDCIYLNNIGENSYVTKENYLPLFIKVNI